ncbi:MAG TPA: ParB N-terminal domain-containing protein [Polyangiaceae bacterium]|nr:ParB N-terminal domain-containing protein [Polyangiaceae bacterium]
MIKLPKQRMRVDALSYIKTHVERPASIEWLRKAFRETPHLVPPIGLVHQGKHYKLHDGNHRLTVARELGLETIEVVIEFPALTELARNDVRFAHPGAR